MVIFDTTLRDGEQSPGASLTKREKLEIAKVLAEMKVDVIEAGFPISSPDDFEGVKAIAQNIKGSEICGLARAIRSDIDACWEAVKYAKKSRIHTFIATSDIHLKYKLKKSRSQVLNQAVEAVKYAKKFTSNVQFSPEDATRSDFAFLCQVIEAVITAGATTINIPDTVGYSVPFEFAQLIKNIVVQVPNIRKATISVHCHDDLGMAVANSLSAIKEGARQIECTINGIGERAGNAALEEVVMSVITRKDLFPLISNVKTHQIHKVSRLVSSLTGVIVQPNKAIVGGNAFAHEAGIHQHGILSKRITYEIMKPESVGLTESKLVLGKHSGRHAFAKRLKDLGYKLSLSQLDKVFVSFKVLADRKKQIYDEDLHMLVEDEVNIGRKQREIFSLDYIHTISGNRAVPTATVRLKKEKEIIQEASCGDGPVDAAYKSIDKICGFKVTLIDYNLRSISCGKDALGEVLIKLKWKEKIINGRGTSTDIIEASAKAYLNAINKIAMRREPVKKGKKSK